MAKQGGTQNLTLVQDVWICRHALSATTEEEATELLRDDPQLLARITAMMQASGMHQGNQLQDVRSGGASDCNTFNVPFGRWGTALYCIVVFCIDSCAWVSTIVHCASRGRRTSVVAGPCSVQTVQDRYWARTTNHTLLCHA